MSIKGNKSKLLPTLFKPVVGNSRSAIVASPQKGKDIYHLMKQSKPIIKLQQSTARDINMNTAPLETPKEKPKEKNMKIKESFSLSKFNQKLTDLGKSTGFIPRIGSNSDIGNIGMLSFEGRIITVQIRSNWGDPEKIILPSIQIMDEKRSRLEILNINTIPKISSEDSNKIVTLTDDNLIKDSSDIVTMNWPPEEEKMVSIILFSSVLSVPRYMRIWNQSGAGSASIKDVNVLDGSDMVFAGEVPSNFGINFELCIHNVRLSSGRIQAYKSSEVLTTLFPSLAQPKGITDLYGRYPLKKVKSVRFEILSTYIDDKFIGLNGIDFYDHKLRLIPYEDIDDLVLEGFTTFKDPKCLFRTDKKTNDWQEMFLAETDWEKHPVIEIKFKKPKYITEIVIWNFNAEKRNLKFGVRKMIIREDKQLMWHGPVTIGTGFLNGMIQCTTPIWFVDTSKIRENDC